MKKWLGLLILILLLSLLISYSCGKGLTPLQKAEKFVGFWVNEDKDTGGITKIDITIDNETIRVHMWGKCHPEDCDWGITTIDISDAEDGILNLTWDHGFAVETQKLSLLSKGRLKVVGSVESRINDVRYKYKAYFIK